MVSRLRRWCFSSKAQHLFKPGLKMKTISSIIELFSQGGVMMSRSRNLFDSLGIFTSAVCLIHCIGLPVLLLLLPSLHLVHDESTHVFLAAWVFLFAALAIRSAVRKANWPVVYLILTGVSAVLVATFAPTVGLAASIETPLITVGNLLVITGHYQNQRARCC